MIFWATTVSGDRLLLGEPREAALSYDRDAPADLLRAKFPADKLWEELEEVTLYENGEPVFRGVVDEQNTRLDSSGLTVELVCRSLEALLLDNEAMPEAILTPSLPVLAEKLLTPLGLSLGEGDREPKHGRLTVNKGESCWTALERFCRDLLHTVPWVDLDGKVHCADRPARALELREVLSAERELLPCKRIGRVWKQSFRGAYDTLYQSEQPAKRRRYLSAADRRDPHEILAQSERDSFRLTVTCAGAWWPVKNAAASVTLPGMGRFEGCPVRSALYRRDKNGERTRLTLERPEREEKICG